MPRWFRFAHASAMTASPVCASAIPAKETVDNLGCHPSSRRKQGSPQPESDAPRHPGESRDLLSRNRRNACEIPACAGMTRAACEIPACAGMTRAACEIPACAGMTEVVLVGLSWFRLEAGPRPSALICGSRPSGASGPEALYRPRVHQQMYEVRRWDPDSHHIPRRHITKRRRAAAASWYAPAMPILPPPRRARRRAPRRRR